MQPKKAMIAFAPQVSPRFGNAEAGHLGRKLIIVARALKQHEILNGDPLEVRSNISQRREPMSSFSRQLR